MSSQNQMHSEQSGGPGHPPAPSSDTARESAAHRWIDEHADILWKFAIARTRSREAAEEIVQETILAAIQGFGLFAGRSSERTWLLGIAAHKIADHLRRSRKANQDHDPPRGEDDDRVRPAHATLFTAAGFWRQAVNRWPEIPTNPSEKSEQMQALRDCIDALPLRQGEAVWLREILGLPSSEVCKALGVTETNLWSTMHRARVALRACLEPKIGLGKENRR